MSARGTSWLTRLERHRLQLDRYGLAELAEAAPSLVDSRYRTLIRERLMSLPEEQLAVHAGLCLAAASLDSGERALLWLTRAQAAVAPHEGALAARIALNLADVHLRSSHAEAASAELAWVESLLGPHAEGAPDVMILRALIADREGHYGAARTFYRRALEGAAHALTPMSRGHALTNLAVALEHSDPRGSVDLTSLALATLEAHALDETTAPLIRNVMGYAWICCGDLTSARQALSTAREEAITRTDRRSQLFASFNLTIVEELEGRIAEAERELDVVRDQAIGTGVPDLGVWADIRRAWLRVRSADPDGGLSILREPRDRPMTRAQADAADVVEVLARAALHAGLADLRSRLGALIARYQARSDMLTAFVLILWRAAIELDRGQERAARRMLEQAYMVGSAGTFKLSPNWWDQRLRDVAIEHSTDAEREYFRSLSQVAPSRVVQPPVPVSIDRDGSILIGGRMLAEDIWRSGRTGPRVLRRFFRALIAAFPGSLERDTLCDLLWPESDGDRALRNLYGATKDLRDVLGSVPGVRLVVDTGRYRLSADPVVTLRPDRPLDSPVQP